MTYAHLSPPLTLHPRDPAPRLVLVDDPGMLNGAGAPWGKRTKIALAVIACCVVLAGGGVGGTIYLRTIAATQIVDAGFEPAPDGLLEAVAQKRIDLLAAYRRLGVKVYSTPRSIEAAIASGSPAVLQQVIDDGARLENEPNAARLLALALRSNDVNLLDAVLKLRPLQPDAVAETYEALRRDGNSLLLVRLAREPLLRTYHDAGGNGFAQVAARASAPDVWNALASGPAIDLKAANGEGETALHVAAAANHPEVIRTILRAGLDPTQQNAHGQTPVSIAYSQRGDEALAIMASENEAAARFLGSNLEALFDKQLRATILALVARGTILDDPSQKGITPLAMAVSADDASIVAALLEKGAKVNAGSTFSNVTGVSPLMVAALRGNQDVVRALLARGADPAQEASNGVTAAALAVRNGHPELAEILHR